MSTRTFLAIVTLAAGGAFLCGTAVSRDQADKAQPVAADPPQPDLEAMKKMMEQWKQAMTPGEAHEKLSFFVGKWDTETKVWWDPSAPPVVTKGSAEAQWELGKRIVLSRYKGTMMLPDFEAGGAPKAVPFEGLGLGGYDNVRKMYVGTWCDSMSTAILTFKGTADPDGKVYRFWGELDEPMLGVYGRYVKYVTRIVDEDTYVFEIYDLHAADDYKVLEITYKRKK